MTTSKKIILVVDDEPLNRKVICSTLHSLGHETRAVASGPEALSALNENIDLVLLDIMMPGMNGYEVARRIRESSCPNVPLIMVTALSGKQERLVAVEAGANDFITKPIDPTELRVRVAGLLAIKDQQDIIKRHQRELEELVDLRTQALSMALDNVRSLQISTRAAYYETISCLSSAAEYRDEETAQHIKRMSRTSALIAKRIGLDDHEVELVLLGSPMHDIGKIGIPDAILLKPGKLDANEWQLMKTHASIGEKILSSSTSEILDIAHVIAGSHHERWDGSGYPRGLAGADIPLHGRICAVADVFDALVSRRPYKQPFSVEKSVAIMREGRGSQFDPQILDLFLDSLDDILAIQNEFSDEA